MNSTWRIVDLVSADGPIKAVMRLKDSKVFSIGDQTEGGTINGFSIYSGMVYASVGRSSINGYDGVSKSLIKSIYELKWV